MPIRWDLAYGGQLKQPLTDELGPDGTIKKAAGSQRWDTDERNPVGVGLNKASGQPGPQLEVFGTPYTDGLGQGDYPPVGLSAVGKAWLPRRTLAGTYDDDWLKNQWPLPPKDFDDAYWNCAPADQQVPHLPAATQILLLHMDVKSSNPKDAKPAGHSGTWQGSLSTSWPCVRLWVAPAGHSDENAQRWEQAMALDTLCIQPSQGLVVATYRYRIAQRSLGDAQLIAIAQWVANHQRVKSRGLWPQKNFAPELLQPAKMPAN